MRTWTTRQAWLFQAGDYPDKGFRAGPDDLDRLIAGTQAADTAPHLDIEHWPTCGVLDFGAVMPSTLRRVTGAPPGGEHGEWIVGDVLVDRDVDRQLLARGLSVTLPADLSRIAAVAVTASPRVAGAQFAETEGGEAAADEAVMLGGYLMPDETTSVPAVAPPEVAPAPEPRAGLLARLLGRGPVRLSAVDEDDGAVVIEQIPVEEVDAAIARAEAAERAQAEAEKAAASARAELSSARAEAAERELSAYRLELTTAGVPPYLVEALAPIALGADQATITMSDGQTHEATAAEAARHVLDAARGAVQMGRSLPVDDEREQPVEERILNRARELSRTDGIGMREAIRRAHEEVQ